MHVVFFFFSVKKGGEKVTDKNKQLCQLAQAICEHSMKPSNRHKFLLLSSLNQHACDPPLNLKAQVQLDGRRRT